MDYQWHHLQKTNEPTTVIASYVKYNLDGHTTDIISYVLYTCITC